MSKQRTNKSVTKQISSRLKIGILIIVILVVGILALSNQSSPLGGSNRPYNASLGYQGQGYYLLKSGSVFYAQNSSAFIEKDVNNNSTITTTSIKTTPVVARFGYVTNAGSGTVSVINLSTDMVVNTIPVGKFPFAIAFNPSGTIAYVADLGKPPPYLSLGYNNYSINSSYGSTISVINTSTDQVVNNITLSPFAFFPYNFNIYKSYFPYYYTHNITNYNIDSPCFLTDVPCFVIDNISSLNQETGASSVSSYYADGLSSYIIAFNPSGSVAYAANPHNNTISVIDTATGTITAAILVGTKPDAVVFNPQGTLVYITDWGYPGAISVINVTTDTVTNTITLTTDPNYIAFNPTGTTAYVINNNSETVSIISVANYSVIKEIYLRSQPISIALNPKGTLAYVVSYTNGNLNGTVTVINTTTNNVTDTIEIGADGFDPSDISFNPSGSTVYVTSLAYGFVYAINTSTNTEDGLIGVGNLPTAMKFN